MTKSISGIHTWQVITRQPTRKVNEDKQVSEYHAAATLAEVMEVISSYLHPDSRVTVIAIIQREPLLTLTTRTP